MTNDEEEEVTLKAGDECPHCMYSPLYEDGGELICVGCDARFPVKEED